MGKKTKKGSKQSAIAHKETFQRMNYLYQVSQPLASLHLALYYISIQILQAALAALSATPSQPQLSRFYIRTMKTVGTRMVLRM